MGQSILENTDDDDASCLETILVMRCSETNRSLVVVINYKNGRYGYSLDDSQYFFIGRTYGQRYCSMDEIECMIESALEAEWGICKKDCPEFESVFENYATRSSLE